MFREQKSTEQTIFASRKGRGIGLESECQRTPSTTTRSSDWNRLQSHQTCVAQVTHSSLTPADINVRAFHTYVQLKLLKALKKQLIKYKIYWK